MFYTLVIAGTMLFSTCGAGVHPNTLNAIIKVESNYNHLAIYDNTTRRSYRPRSEEHAILITETLLSCGHSLDIGLMQINSQHLAKLNIDHRQLFNSCFNISIGTKILKDFYRTHARKNPDDDPDITLLKALSSYNTGNPNKGKKYVNNILRAAGININSPVTENDTEVILSTEPTTEGRKAR